VTAAYSDLDAYVGKFTNADYDPLADSPFLIIDGSRPAREEVFTVP